MILSTYLELKLLKNPFWKPSIHYYSNKGNRKVKDLQKLSNKEISKTTLDFISEHINLKLTFNIPFKISLKALIIKSSLQFMMIYS